MPTKTQLNKKLLDEVYDIYTQAEIDILKNIAKKQKKGNKVEGWAEWKLKDIQELREETRKALEGPNKKVKNIMSDNLLKIYKGAKTSVSSDLGVPMTAISDIVSPKLQRLILETNQLIDGTSVRILRNVDDVYREIIAQTSTGVLSGMDTREQAIQKALNKFADKGITGFVDRIGRQWEMASYVDMAIRTTTSNAALQGHVDRQTELGEDLMIVSSFGNTCPLCMPWEGVVLSISGNTLKYQSLDSAKAAGLFHPNCKHTLLAYVEGITEPVKQEPEPEVYGAQQKQRHNERQIRKWKRREAVALSPKEQVTASNKVKQWQSIQRDHIKEWDLRRNYKRESIKGRAGVVGAEKPRVKIVVPTTPAEVQKSYYDTIPDVPKYTEILSKKISGTTDPEQTKKRLELLQAKMTSGDMNISKDNAKLINHYLSSVGKVDFAYKDPNPRRTVSHYVPKGSRINMPRQRILVDIESGRGATFHHELGHHIDQMNGLVSKTDVEFMNAVVNDTMNYKKMMKSKHGSAWTSKANSEMHGLGDNGGGISDAFQIITKHEISGGQGHSKDYAKSFKGSKKEQVAASEVFAQLFSADISNATEVENFKTYMPETYKEYKRVKQTIIDNLKER